MTTDAHHVPPPSKPDFDESGVDLAQVRAMLDLTPAERLTRVSDFTGSLLAARAQDDEPRSA